jgi:rhamnosyltransferase
MPGRVDQLAAERDALRARIEHLEKACDRSREEANRRAAELERLAGERDRLEEEAGRLVADRDRWRNEADHAWERCEQLASDLEGREDHDQSVEEARRGSLRIEAESWRRETERLVLERERRFAARLRRRGFRIARKLWWALPGRVRDWLRPVLFPPTPTPVSRGRAFRMARRLWWVLPRRVRDALRRVLFKRAAAPKVVNHRLERVARLPAPPVRETPPPTVAREKVVKPQESLTEPLSVVMPTFNAGPDFPRILAAIRRQVGLRELDLVIVDSGSEDGTREAAENAGARVIEIPESDFGHGRTRNRGIELSDGEFVVMMVQDALMLGVTAIRDLAVELRADPRMAAISARQVPRTDADLFASFVVLAHARTLDAERPSQTPSLETLTPLQRRAVAGIDNVCAVIRRGAWMELGFSDVQFGEDLDFGLRACDSGWTIGFSKSVAVAHSHTRGPLYQFRRSVADRLYIAPLAAEDAHSGLAGVMVEEVMAGGRVLLSSLEGVRGVVAGADHQPLWHTLVRVAEILAAGAPRVPPGGDLLELDDFFRRHNNVESSPGVLELLQRELLALLRWKPLEEFSRGNQAVSGVEIGSFIAKLGASVVGRAAGDSLRANAAGAARLLEGI